MGKIFISYAREDAGKAESIRNGLNTLGFNVWMDAHNLAANDDITTVIDAKIKDVDVVLVLWSEASRKSVWVRGEALRGLENDKYFGVLLDAISPPVPFNSLNAPNLMEWTGLHSHAGWNSLVRKMAEMTVPPSKGVVSALDKVQAKEKAAADAAAAIQEALPLGIDDTPTTEDMPTRTHDLKALVEAAGTVLSSGAKSDLENVIVQAALDQEILRDANYVVGPNPGSPAPSPSSRIMLASLEEALQVAVDGDVIAILQGEYKTNARVTKNVRIAGIGSAHQRPTLAAKGCAAVISFENSAIIENLNIETRENAVAVICGVETQPSLLRCDIRRFSKQDAKDEDAALHVSRQSHPVVMSTSITATGCEAIRIVGAAGGDFMGVNILTSRGIGILCRGWPKFLGCSIDAVGGHAVLVRGTGQPSFEACEVSGRGAPVVHVMDYARPKMRASRVKAIRQLAFDFEGDASGIYESNIVQYDSSQEAGTIREEKSNWFGVFSRQKKAVTSATQIADRIMRLRSKGKPVFIANTLSTGEELPLPL